MPMKLVVWFIIPAVIIWIMYLSYRYLNRTTPEDGSKEWWNNLDGNDHDEFI